MAINLHEIPAAVRNYFDTKVTVDIIELKPDGGDTINPNEGFRFNVTVRNANAASGGIRLTDVRYHLKVARPAMGPAVARLIVPGRTHIIARSDQRDTDPLLTPGDLVEEMYLFPLTSDERKVLDVGETDTISALVGKAGGNESGGTTEIQFNVIASVDIFGVFLNVASRIAREPLVVEG